MKNNIYRNSEFLISAHDPAQFPPDKGREVAFAGRSNTGKSSVINTITGKKSLARVSKTPGRTQQINFFTVKDGIRMVDLPGYGYARVPGRLRRHWAKLVNTYFEQRRSLRGVILITDIRRQLTDYDKQMLVWSAQHQLPACILLNKADKLSSGAAKKALLDLEKEIDRQFNRVLLFSALKKTGVAEVCDQLDRWLV